MKFVCDKEKLSEVTSIVQKAVSSKAVMPILECLKIEASGNGNIVMTGNNLDLCIEHSFQCDVEEGGSVALTSRIFGEIIRRMPSGNVSVTVNEENNITKIKCGASEFNIQGLFPEEYPAAPVINEKRRFSLSQGKLKNIIRKTISFVAMSEGKRPALTGVLFEIKNNILNAAASDAHRLAVIKEEFDGECGEVRFIIPGQTLRELIKILRDGDERVDVIISDRHVLFDFGEYKVYTRLLEGEFLNYRVIISAVNSISIRVEKRSIMDSLERAILLINDDSSSSEVKVPVRFNINFDKIDISCITGKGQVNDSVSAEINGDPLEIGFNCRFLLDAMNVCDEDIVKMELSTPTGGCFFKPEDGSDAYTYMVLPVRLYN